MDVGGQSKRWGRSEGRSQKSKVGPEWRLYRKEAGAIVESGPVWKEGDIVGGVAKVKGRGRVEDETKVEGGTTVEGRDRMEDGTIVEGGPEWKKGDREKSGTTVEGRDRMEGGTNKEG
jgi:hypothetical protein